MKRSFILACVAALSATVSAETRISDVMVHQLWPWSKNVSVEFVAHGVTGVQQLETAITVNGETVGTVPLAAYRTVSSLCGNGKYHVEFDPTAVPCLAGSNRKIGVALTVSEVPADERLYYIFDLTKTAGAPGETVCVTAAALTNGLWGTWERQFWPKGEDAICWTGVTNDAKYATTHLVMRRIPAGTFKMGYASDDDAPWKERELAQKSVQLSQPYYIGVYEVTVAQWSLLAGRGADQSLGANDLTRPTLSDSYNNIRGAYSTPGGLYDWPNETSVDPASYIGRLRGLTGRAFDLPTEAQWEKACKAGTDGVYYNGDRTTNRATRNRIAWNASNSANDAAGTNYVVHAVGLLLPNNYGLYDMLGNAHEYVRDWMAGSGGSVADVDPVGPTAAGADYWYENKWPKRMAKGGSFNTGYTYNRPAFRTQNPTILGDPSYGWRVSLPAD